MIEHAQQVAAEIREVERTIIVVARAVTSRVPRCGVKFLAEHRQLIVPVSAIAADSVHAEHQRPAAEMINRDSGRARDVVGFPFAHRVVPPLRASPASLRQRASLATIPARHDWVKFATARVSISIASITLMAAAPS